MKLNFWMTANSPCSLKLKCSICAELDITLQISDINRAIWNYDFEKFIEMGVLPYLQGGRAERQT